MVAEPQVQTELGNRENPRAQGEWRYVQVDLVLLDSLGAEEVETASGEKAAAARPAGRPDGLAFLAASVSNP